MSWLEETLDAGIAEIMKEREQKGWFSLSAISKVPYIQYPDFSEKECKELQMQAQNVLRISRNENNYQEVAITYNLKESDDNRNKYKKVLGDYSKLAIMDDEQTRTILNNANTANELVIISIHNHPNNSNFSINDLMIFTENPCIRLMEIVNKNGEISFLLRPYPLDLKNILIRNIFDIVPDFMERKKEWMEQHPDSKNFRIYDIIEAAEGKMILQESLYELQQRGVYYSRYLDEQKAKNLTFTASGNVIAKTGTASSELHGGEDMSSLESDITYLENGEDGYEWEYPEL